MKQEHPTGQIAAIDSPPLPIAADEQVVFFPTVGRSEGGDWLLPIHGWIFNRRDDSFGRAVLLASLRRVLGLARTADQAELFRRRAMPFLARSKRRRAVAIRIGETVFPLPPSGVNGHFWSEITIPRGRADLLASAIDGRTRTIDYHAIVGHADQRVFAGRVYLLGETGLSVVSDIDDTIKITEVHDWKRLLRRQFLQPFEAIPGLAAAYTAWARLEASFHYVSAAPWQLFQPMHEFLALAGFPEGTFHMRSVRFKDRTLLDLFAAADRFKRIAIVTLLRTFPRRQFILVGDSGQRDPEVFGELARECPKQVSHIFIRDVAGVAGQAEGAPRYQEAFREVPRQRWTVFTDITGMRPIERK